MTQLGKTRKKPKQEPPIQFRSGSELGELVSAFAEDRRLTVNEAYKDLAALAVVGLDARHHELLAHMAAAMSGRHGFVRAAVHVRAALQAGTRVSAGLLAEPNRTRFLIETVQDYLKTTGRLLPAKVASSVLTRIGSQPTPDSGGFPPRGASTAKDYASKRRRTVKASLIGAFEPANAPSTVADLEEKAEFQSTDYGREKQRQRLREGQ